MTDTHHDRLLIIDFGSQVTQLIARRLRELNVYCEIHPFNLVNDAFLDRFNPRAIILSGGPASVIDKDSPRAPERVFNMGVPVLGICYGQQVMMTQLGGLVERGIGTAEFGRAFVTPTAENRRWVHGVRHLAQRALCDHCRYHAKFLRRAISSRGASHTKWRKIIRKFCETGWI